MAKICKRPGCGKEFTPSKFRPNQEYCSPYCAKSTYMKGYNQTGARRRAVLPKETCPLCGSETNKWIRDEYHGRVCFTCSMKKHDGKPVASALHSATGARLYGREWWIGRKMGKFEVVDIPFEPLSSGPGVETIITLKCRLGHVFERQAGYVGSICPVCDKTNSAYKIKFVGAQIPDAADFTTWHDLLLENSRLELIHAPATHWSKHKRMKVTMKCWCGKIWEPNWTDVTGKRITCCGCITKSSMANEEIFQLVSGYIDSVQEHQLEDRFIDIYIPKFNLAIEHNGLKWHTGNSDYEKYNLCKRYGIRYVGIYGDEWIKRKPLFVDYIKCLIYDHDSSLIKLREIDPYALGFHVMSISADSKFYNNWLAKAGYSKLVSVEFDGDEIASIHKDAAGKIYPDFNPRVCTKKLRQYIVRHCHALGVLKLVVTNNRFDDGEWLKEIGFKEIEQLPQKCWLASGKHRELVLNEKEAVKDGLNVVADCGYTVWEKTC